MQNTRKAASAVCACVIDDLELIRFLLYPMPPGLKNNEFTYHGMALFQKHNRHASLEWVWDYHHAEPYLALRAFYYMCTVTIVRGEKLVQVNQNWQPKFVPLPKMYACCVHDHEYCRSSATDINHQGVYRPWGLLMAAKIPFWFSHDITLHVTDSLFENTESIHSHFVNLWVSVDFSIVRLLINLFTKLLKELLVSSVGSANLDIMDIILLLYLQDLFKLLHQKLAVLFPKGQVLKPTLKMSSRMGQEKWEKPNSRSYSWSVIISVVLLYSIADMGQHELACGGKQRWRWTLVRALTSKLHPH